MGSRSGGVDGKGGFLAVLHPKETVIDHTRLSTAANAGFSAGAGMAQQVHVTVGISAGANGNLMPFVESVTQRKIKAAAPGIIGTAVNESTRRVVPTLAKHQTQKAGGDYRNS
jgi:hypothetical protein